MKKITMLTLAAFLVSAGLIFAQQSADKSTAKPAVTGKTASAEEGTKMSVKKHGNKHNAKAHAKTKTQCSEKCSSEKTK
jgi:hypothetical protein